MINKHPKFSQNHRTKSLQNEFIDAFEKNDGDFTSFLDDLMDKGQCPVQLIVFIFNWLEFRRNVSATSSLVRLLRRHEFDFPSVYERECKWVWSLGFRERVFATTVTAHIKWENDSLLNLAAAMYDELNKETAEDLTDRNTQTATIPIRDLPFNPNQQHTLDEPTMDNFLSKLNRYPAGSIYKH